MNLIKEKWAVKDLEEFKLYQNTLKGDVVKIQWEQRIINTKLPCLAQTTSKARKVAKEIAKGNYLNFLDNIKVETLFDSLVCAFLISKISKFNVFKRCLLRFVKTIDNWASCDTIRFKSFDYKKLFQLAKQLLKSKKEFIRRVGVNIFFEIYNSKEYVNEAFKVIDYFKDCKQYYVNMSCAWLLSFIYIKYPELALKYFKNHNTSKFIINKAISKCCDSYRISLHEKHKLKTFVVK